MKHRRKISDLPSIELIRFLLIYADGKLYWRNRPVSMFSSVGDCKKWNTRRAGKEAGSITVHGRVSVKVGELFIFAHHIVWAIKTGYWPVNEIDHKDGNPLNNCIDNLREATRSEQMQNRVGARESHSGLLGAHWHDKKQKWHARITANGKRIHIGYYDTPEEASAAYLEAKKIHHAFQPVPRDLLN